MGKRAVTALFGVVLVLCSWAERPIVERVDAGDVGNVALYQTIENPQGQAERRVRVYSAPVWYPDPETGTLRAIDTAARALEDAESGEAGLGCESNTVRFVATEAGDAVYRVGKHQLRLWMDGLGGEAKEAGERVARVEAARPSLVVPQNARTIAVRDVLPGVTVRHRVVPGAVKEEIEVATRPETKGLKTVDYTWRYASDLTPTLRDGAIVWSNGATSPLTIPAPQTHDADSNPLASWWSVGDGSVTLHIDAGEMEGAAYPVTIDPTVETDQGDATANRSYGEEDYAPADYWKAAYMLVTLPDLSTELGGGYTITEAWWHGRCQTDYGTGSGAGSIFCDITSAWSESSDAATLAALSFNDPTQTGINGDIASGTWAVWDILGDGTCGISKIYDDDTSPDPATLKILVYGGDDAGTRDLISNTVRIGDSTSGSGGQGTIFYPRTDATNFWYVEIVLTAAGAGPEDFPSGSAGVSIL